MRKYSSMFKKIYWGYGELGSSQKIWYQRTLNSKAIGKTITIDLGQKNLNKEEK